MDRGVDKEISEMIDGRMAGGMYGEVIRLQIPREILRTICSYQFFYLALVKSFLIKCNFILECIGDSAILK